MTSCRLHKFLAQATGLSRRVAEAAVAAGEVRLNGRVVTKLGVVIDPTHARVEWRGARLRAVRRFHYLAYYKPKQVVTTKSDPQRRRTVWSLLPERFDGLDAAGRLDYDSEGLLILTDDGAVVARLTQPRFAVEKVYWVKLSARPTAAALAQWTQGIPDDGTVLRAARVRMLRAEGAHAWVEAVLTEGQTRELRRMAAAIGLTVLKLKRTAMGPVRLGRLKPGAWRKLTSPEVQQLQHSACHSQGR
ncbi:MAG: rRNA pseudouridine synthase [Deltaproteobacteria bacterium]|nr:rRNA pseudouridine synthase [Deltaproteobacteria bacterium]